MTKAQQNAAEAKAADTEAKAEDAAAEETVEVKEEIVFPFSLADGRSVTSLKGVLANGEEIKAEYLVGGKKALDALVKAKIVNKA